MRNIDDQKTILMITLTKLYNMKCNININQSFLYISKIVKHGIADNIGLKCGDLKTKYSVQLVKIILQI